MGPTAVAGSTILGLERAISLPTTGNSSRVENGATVSGGVWKQEMLAEKGAPFQEALDG